MAENGQTPFHIEGEEIASCNCDWGCPCQFNANPTHGHCHALVAVQIEKGHFGDTDMGGVSFAEIISWPGPIHEGDGTVQLILDESSSEEQHEAVKAMASGEHGGTFFEIFSSVLPHVREPVVKKVEIETDRERRVGSIKVGDLGQTEIGPITNPVTGDEHRARIDLPEGFEYAQAEVGNTVSAETHGDDPLSFTLENTHAQLNRFDWSNA